MMLIAVVSLSVSLSACIQQPSQFFAKQLTRLAERWLGQPDCRLSVLPIVLHHCAGRLHTRQGLPTMFNMETDV